MVRLIFALLLVFAPVAMAAIDVGPGYLQRSSGCQTLGGVVVGSGWGQIKNAIEAGGLVRIQPGTYNVTSSVIVGSSTTIASNNCGEVVLNLETGPAFQINGDSVNIIGLTVRSSSQVGGWVTLGPSADTISIYSNDVELNTTGPIVHIPQGGNEGLTLERNRFAKKGGAGNVLLMESCDLQGLADPGNVGCFGDADKLANGSGIITLTSNLFTYGFSAGTYQYDSMVRIHGYRDALLIQGNQFGESRSPSIGQRHHLALSGVSVEGSSAVIRQNTYYCEAIVGAGDEQTGPCVDVALHEVSDVGVATGGSPLVVFDRELWVNPVVSPAVDRNRSGSASGVCDTSEATCSTRGALSGFLGLGDAPQTGGRANVVIMNSVVYSAGGAEDRMSRWNHVDGVVLDHVTMVRGGFDARTPICSSTPTYSAIDSIMHGSQVGLNYGPTCTGAELDNENLLLFGIVGDMLQGTNRIFSPPEFISTMDAGHDHFNFGLTPGAPGSGEGTGGLDIGAFHIFTPTSATIVNDPQRILIEAAGIPFPVEKCDSGRLSVAVNGSAANVRTCTVDYDTFNVASDPAETVAFFIDRTIGAGDTVEVSLQTGALLDGLSIGGEGGAEFMVNRNTSSPVNLTATNLITSPQGVPLVSFALPGWQLVENSNDLGVCIQTINPVASPIEVQLLYNGSAGILDAVGPSTVTIGIGKTQAEAIITFDDDLIAEGKEEMIITIAASTAYDIAGQSSHIIDVYDDESALPTGAPEPSLNFLMISNVSVSNVSISSR